MKTIYTTLPIYDRIEKQTFERSKRSVPDRIYPIICPTDQLPSFQWIDNTATSVSKIETIHLSGSVTDITSLLTLPTLVTLTANNYFVYYGGALSGSLDCGKQYLRITTDAGTYYSDWFDAEDLTDYPYKCLKIDFSNNCDLGNILYQTGFTQTAWLLSEPMETSFPIEEEGVKNGEGLFVPTFRKQPKKYIARIANMPDFMLDVFERMRLHDTILLTDLVGDQNEIFNLEVEHEWTDDKYYALVTLTFDYDETVIISGCCNNLI